jgi:hypothetical protein
VEGEGAPRRTHLDHIVYLHLGMQVRTGGTMRLLLDAHPIVIGTRRVRKRVVA